MASFYEYGDEPSGSIKAGNVLTSWAVTRKMEKTGKCFGYVFHRKIIVSILHKPEEKWAILLLNVITVFEHAETRNFL
jgi:hypothetical protein